MGSGCLKVRDRESFGRLSLSHEMWISETPKVDPWTEKRQPGNVERMVTHKLRVLIIGIGAALALIAVVVLVALGQDEGTGFGVVTGVLGTLIPALVDSLGEQKKQKRESSLPSGDLQ
jgi:hypothetical protein